MIVGLIYGKITSVTAIKSTIYHVTRIGDWPSGKAPGSGPGIGGSNPSSPAKFSNRGEKCTFLCVFLFSPFHRLCYLGFESLEPDITTAVSLIVFFDANNDTVLLTLLKNSGIITLHRSMPYERL